jgi:hypothetical protein
VWPVVGPQIQNFIYIKLYAPDIYAVKINLLETKNPTDYPLQHTRYQGY